MCSWETSRYLLRLSVTTSANYRDKDEAVEVLEEQLQRGNHPRWYRSKAVRIAAC